ncbi:MAG: DUF3604 domain-containing protein, partial [Pseudomonadota bacterium]
MRRFLMLAASAAALVACGGPADAPETDAQSTDANGLASTQAAAAPDRTTGYSETRNAYFGDMHIHTRNSFDAYIFNVRRTADDAYRFAKGETVPHPSGFDMTIAGGPLDFYTVTDHAEYLGILPAMDNPDHELSELERSQDMFS